MVVLWLLFYKNKKTIALVDFKTIALDLKYFN